MNTAIGIVKKFAPHVRNVKDAKRGITIRVVNKDIKKKGIKDHAGCAVAEACKRAFDADAAIVGTKTAYIIFGKQAIRFRIPAKTSEEIKAFDLGRGFTLGFFDLDAPRKGEKLGGGYTGASHNLSTRKRPHFNYHDRKVRAILR